MEPIPHRKDYIHHYQSSYADVLKEMVFGMEDGMVSTLGSITGIAIGSGNITVVLLAGVVIISVEAISMGIGSYVSNVSEEEMHARMIAEEKQELRDFADAEREELKEIYIKNNWPAELSVKMAEAASQNPDLFLHEMIVHELKIPNEKSVSLKGAVFMFFAYILGGLIPLSSYLFVSFQTAIYLSIGITLVGLFLLGIAITKFTKAPILRSGVRMLLMGGAALLIGLLAGIFMR